MKIQTHVIQEPDPTPTNFESMDHEVVKDDHPIKDNDNLETPSIAASEPVPIVESMDPPECTTSVPNAVVEVSSSPTTADEGFVPPATTKADQTSSVPILVFTLFTGLAAFILYSTLVQAHILYSTAPLTLAGHILAPGSWRSQCGLFHLLPTKVFVEIHTPYDRINSLVSSLLYKTTSPAYCPVSTSLSVYMGKNGTLEVYRGTQIIYALVGKSCSASSSSTVLQSFLNSSENPLETSECLAGAKVSETGSIEIGGQLPSHAIFYGKEKSSSILNDLHSWPFGQNIILPPDSSIETLSNDLKNKAEHVSQPKPKTFPFPWKDMPIVWPWEKEKMTTPEPASHKGTDVKFPLKNIKIGWPWKQDKKN